MKIVVILILAFCTASFGQEALEYNIQFNSGLFSFSGISAERVEKINYNLENEDGYTNNPYGKKSGLSYGVSVKMVKIARSNFRFGIDLGYEMLRSKIGIDRVWEHGNSVNKTVEAKGRTYLNSSFINLFPSLGQRFSVSGINIDVDAGPDLAYILNVTERGSAKSSLREYKTKRDRKTINSDVRARIQVGFSKNDIGGYIGYSKGFKNHMFGYVGGTNEVYSNLIRFGVFYKLGRKSTANVQ